MASTAGSGTIGRAGVGGPAGSVQLANPSATALDLAGNLYISDSLNHRVLRVSAITNLVSLVAGTGTAGFSGDGGPGVDARLNAPTGLAVSGNILFIADTLNHRVRQVDLSTGTMLALAGSGPTDPQATFGSGALGGDGGPAAAARLNTPSGLASDGQNLYIADAFNSRIRRVSLSGSFVITTVAGNGSNGAPGDGGPPAAAALGRPGFIAFSPQGTLWVPDATNHRVWEIDFANDRIQIVAGTGERGYSGEGQPPLLAKLDGPVGVAFDFTGGALISEYGNHRIRRIHRASNTITTIAGSGPAGTPVGSYAGDPGLGLSARFSQPGGLTRAPSGAIIVVDSLNNRIRTLTPAIPSSVPAMFNLTLTTSVVNGNTGQRTFHFDFIDADGDITYNGTFRDAAVITVADPNRPGCTDLFISPALGQPGNISGTVDFAITGGYVRRKSSPTPFPLLVTLDDAAGRRSDAVRVNVTEWFSFCP